MKKNFRYLVFLVFILALSTNSFSTIRVVDHKIANPGTNGYNFETRKITQNGISAFKTIQQAIDGSDEGDTLFIRQGVYKESIKINKNELTIKSYNNENVLIDGNNPRLGPLIEIQASNITLIGLTVKHSSSYGIYSTNNNNIVVKDCHVAYSEDGGIVFVNGENVLINNCKVHHNNYKGLQAGHEGITLRGVKYFEVRNCEVYDNKEEGIDAKYGSVYGKIHHNSVYRNNGPQIYVDVANNIEIYNNIIHDAISKSGISLNIESTWKPEELAWTLHNIKVYNNLIFNNHGGIGFWLEPGKGSEVNAHWDSIIIVNNTLVNNSQPNSQRGGGIYIANGEPHNFGDNMVIKNNIIWEKTNDASRCFRDHSGAILGKFTITHNILPSNVPTDIKGENSLIVSEIHFVDAFNHDYRLMKNSPAIGAGHLKEAPSIDLDNKIRNNEKNDIGAYKWVIPIVD